MTKKYLLPALAAIMIFMLAACGSTNNTGKNTPENSQAPKESATNSEQAQETKESPDEKTESTVTVVDASGTEVTVPINPKRVAIYDLAILDTLNTIGFEKTHVETLGLPKTDSSLPDYLSEYTNDKYVNVGTLFEADFDALDLLQPEIIFYGGRFGARTAEGKNLEDTQKKFNNTKFISLNIEGDQFEEGLARNAEILGKIFPDAKEGLDAGITELKQGFAEISAKAKDTNTLFLMIGPGFVTFYGKEGRYAMVHREFGFKPADEETEAKGSHGADVSVEYIKTKNPQAILLLDRNASFGEDSSVKAFLENSIIQETDAYKNDAIYILDPPSWYLVTGGYTSTKQMIADLKVFSDKQ